MVSSSPSPTVVQRLASHRQQLPALANKHYFNYGGQGPLPQVALDALYQAHVTFQAQGPYSGTVKQWMTAEATATREALGQLLQIPPETLTLTENVTVGCNIPLWGIDWQAGDRILMTDCEHPGVVAAVQEVSRRFELAVDICDLLPLAKGEDFLSGIAAALHPRTRLLVINHVLWNTGQCLPLADIVALCHGRTPAVQVLADAAQSVGMMPLDLPSTGVDFYAFTGHKWCCGPAGLGGLYISPAVRDQIAPTFIGWRSITIGPQAAPTGWEPSGKRYEVATSDYPLLASLRAALQFHDAWAPQGDRYGRMCQLGQQLWQRLRGHPRIAMVTATPPASGLVSFQVLDAAGEPSPALHNRLVNALEADGQFLRTLLYPHCVRACLHYFTLESEVEELGDRIAQWLDGELPGV